MIRFHEEQVNIANTRMVGWTKCKIRAKTSFPNTIVKVSAANVRLGLPLLFSSHSPFIIPTPLFIPERCAFGLVEAESLLKETCKSCFPSSNISSLDTINIDKHESLVQH